MKCMLFFCLVIQFGVCIVTASSEDFVGKLSYGIRHEYLDHNGIYSVEWEAYSDTKTVVFELTVATIGYVGFGISPAGGMTGADIIIAGIHPNGSAYISNRHGIGNEMPEVDDSETWKLIKASENTTHTYLKVGRRFNTCDSQDVAITNSTNNFIWSFGQDDVIEYHGSNRGTSANNILDPAMPSMDTPDFQLWRMSHTMEMPAQSTTYWCTVQKSPSLASKHHIVGYRAILDTPEALKHKHHIIVHKCRAPYGSTDEETFEPFIGQPGDECYIGSSNVPMEYCETYQFLWAVGGKTAVFPEHIGYPFSVDGEPSYYLLQVHYDNPNNVQGVTFETGVEFFYSSKLRSNDAATIVFGHSTSWALTIPPKSEEFIIVGHCSPSCSSYIPESGINVFSVAPHSHLAGRRMRLRHYRDGKELPWLSSDDNYNFDYQQNRPILEEIKIFPGDQLTYECTYESTHANGTIIGGMSTAQEMCSIFIGYYPEIDLEACRSEYPRNELLAGFGMEIIRGGVLEDPVVLSPEHMSNNTYTEVLNTIIPWTKENRDHFQQQIRYGAHNVVCGMAGRFLTNTDTVKYPNAAMEYVPIDECTRAPIDENQDLESGSAIKSSLHFMACILSIIPTMQWL